MVLLVAAVVVAAAVAGCTSSAPDVVDGQPSDVLVDAYSAGMGYHTQGQDDFNNGTAAWENEDLRAAIAGYANASMAYGDAANCYGLMARYATSPEDVAFAESLKGCAYNLSLASDDFMNAAIALERNDSDGALDRFNVGQEHLAASDEMLNRSIELTPAWLEAMVSG